MTDDLAAWLLEQFEALTREVQDASALPGNAKICAYLTTDLESKRRIVALHSHTTESIWQDHSKDFEVCDECGAGEGNQGCTPWPCTTLQLLALPFAELPGFREEWRPT